ncbi:hypothetical protein J6590_007611 [Homalodisca vitripennis]|nr:hypothetical protein J6590_007611 [Homalodisca vitripennis]
MGIHVETVLNSAAAVSNHHYPTRWATKYMMKNGKENRKGKHYTTSRQTRKEKGFLSIYRLRVWVTHSL